MMGEGQLKKSTEMTRAIFLTLYQIILLETGWLAELAARITHVITESS